ncbi:hypothetical protein SLS53_005554 [Cytospora paraplurivora]|uniref:DUF7707 domain-containing protein n=1 Tax=Cytospora paraplurivora TaxID=2898453 RepID=A0AAN9YFY9_9PEZI
MRSFFAVAALSALLVAAENSTFSIDPSEVKLTTRASWCQGQTSTCSILCDSNPVDNSCDVNTLDFECTCTNGSAPGLQYYTQTIDTAYDDCISANVGDSTGQKNCTTSIQDNCGTLDPSDYTATTTTSSAAASTAAATSAATASSASTVASTTSSQAAAAATNLQHIGTGAFAVGMGALAYLL